MNINTPRPPHSFPSAPSFTEDPLSSISPSRLIHHIDNTMDNVILGTDGQTICRPTTWKDVLKFFILNYGLHVLTIVSAPGSKTVPTMIRSLGVLLIPFSGTFTALDVIHRFARGQSGDLQTAHREGPFACSCQRGC